ncbi:MAG TPA: hypothetical protein VME20_08375 [Acidimicrobiales bacterium]|nr:hypothetical protein [Acidimicrobiales bacterium]
MRSSRNFEEHSRTGKSTPEQVGGYREPSGRRLTAEHPGAGDLRYKVPVPDAQPESWPGPELPLRCLLSRFAGPLMAAHRLAEQPLDLGVDRAQVGGGPAFELGPQLGVDAQQELLASRHTALTGRACRC